MKPNKCVEYFQEYSEKNKTVKDGDITVDHQRLGDHQFFLDQQSSYFHLK